MKKHLFKFNFFYYRSFTGIVPSLKTPDFSSAKDFLNSNSFYNFIFNGDTF